MLPISVMLSVRLLRKSWKVKNFKILDSKFSCGELFQDETSFFLSFSEQPKEKINECTFFSDKFCLSSHIMIKRKQFTSNILDLEF